MQFGFKCVKSRKSLSKNVPFYRLSNYINYTLLNITFQWSERHNFFYFHAVRLDIIKVIFIHQLMH
jgi:hypothetical protein